MDSSLTFKVAIMNINMAIRRMVLAILASGFFALLPTSVRAHCDTLDGPVIADARLALASEKVTPVLKWIKAEYEQEVGDAFQKTLIVRKMGDTAQELADRFFFETVVRVHRAGEGAPYTGLKPAGTVDPAVSLADQALKTHSPEKLVIALTQAVASGIRRCHTEASERLKHSANSVEAGRRFVKAYVQYVHFVEALHLLLKGASHSHQPAVNGAHEEGQ